MLWGNNCLEKLSFNNLLILTLHPLIEINGGLNGGKKIERERGQKREIFPLPDFQGACFAISILRPFSLERGLVADCKGPSAPHGDYSGDS